MPRKGVPYGDGVCSLKERIAELEQRMASLVNTINHIAANSGDISIAADAPLNVTNDATAHKITVGVSKDNTPIEDSSALVTSGGVRAAIDAGDAEAVKLTGDQSIAGVKSFSSNPKIAAPASGATDDSAVNANWVSQSGEGKPNNLIHMNGTEIIYGTKIFQSRLLGRGIQLRTVNMDVTKPGSSDKYSNSILWVDENNIEVCKLWVRQRSNGRIALGMDIKKSDNTWDFGHIIYEST